MEAVSAAVAAFQTKYLMLPGDLTAQNAVELGFLSRSGEEGRGDGNGLVQSCELSCSGVCPVIPLGCEVVLFWSDLSLAGLVDGSFGASADDYVQASSFADTLGYFPEARLGGSTVHPTTCGQSELWLVLIRISRSTLGGGGGTVTQGGNIRVSDAYLVDAKLDDGLARSGRVRVNGVAGSSAEGYYCNVPAPPTGCVDAQGEYRSGTDAPACQINYRIAAR